MKFYCLSGKSFETDFKNHVIYKTQWAIPKKDNHTGEGWT